MAHTVHVGDVALLSKGSCAASLQLTTQLFNRIKSHRVYSAAQFNSSFGGGCEKSVELVRVIGESGFLALSERLVKFDWPDAFVLLDNARSADQDDLSGAFSRNGWLCVVQVRGGCTLRGLKNEHNVVQSLIISEFEDESE